MGEILTRDGNIDADGLPVFRDKRALEQGVIHGGIAYFERIFRIFRHIFHQPVYADGARPCRFNIINIAGSHDIAGDDLTIGMLWIAEGGDKRAEALHVCKGRRIEDSIGMGVVDHTEDNNIMEIKIFLSLVMKNTNRLVLGEHIFRIRVHPDTDNSGKNGQQQRHKDNDCGNLSGFIQ